jgi:hypothetical protein
MVGVELFRFHGELQWITFEARREVRLVDAPLCFGLGESLNIRAPIEMRGIHNIRGVRGWKHEDRDQNVSDEIHRRDFIVVDDDAIKRTLVGLLFFLFDFLRYSL